MKSRKIKKVIKNKPTLEGAGVHLNRVFGNNEAPLLDPFLLLDDFRSGNPAHYLKGFPWHPHRGIETITYMLGGSVEHGDSMGNKGLIGAGDVQWMTAGSGIIHQEMPKGDKAGYMGGFQLWANLPASHKMMHPRYRDVTSSQIPEVSLAPGVKIKIICGEVGGIKGPVHDIVTEPEYMDVTLSADAEFTHPAKPGHTVLAYIIDGRGYFDEEGDLLSNGELAWYGSGGKITLRPVAFSFRQTHREPVPWFGPKFLKPQKRLLFERLLNGFL